MFSFRVSPASALQMSGLNMVEDGSAKLQPKHDDVTHKEFGILETDLAGSVLRVHMSEVIRVAAKKGGVKALPAPAQQKE